MPRGVYFQAAMRWPHMFLTLSPTYIGLAQAAYDFTVRYLRGEVPGTPPVKRRMYPTKQIAVAEMQIKLQQIKAIWFQAITEARANPTKEQVLRAYAAQYTIMEGANELATLAIRTCGGQAMLKSLPLERIYRDSRCGSLMLPWTAELCLDRIGREALYETGETDDEFDHGPLRSHRAQRRLHARQAGAVFEAKTSLRGLRRPHRTHGARAEVRVRRRPRRPRRDPQPEPAGLSRAALRLRTARRHAGAAELAAGGGRATVHPVGRPVQGAAARTGLRRRSARAAKTACPGRVVGLDFAPPRGITFEELLARAPGDGRNPQPT